MPKKLKSVDVEYLFTTVSNQRVYGVSPPIPRVILTPRSSEALLRCGIDPEELRIRDLDSFWEPGIDPKVQRLRHEDYSTRRRELMTEVRETRAQIEKEHEAQGKSPSRLSARNGLLSPASIQGGDLDLFESLAEQDDGIQTLVKQEEARLWKIQQKKKQEVEQMLAFEMRQLELQEETQAKLRAEEERRRRLKKQEERRKREEMELKRAKEMQRQAILEFEERQRQKLAEEAFLREKELAEKKKQEEEDRAREARKREMEREEKARAQKEKTEQILRKRELEIERKKREAEEKERKRLEKLERQKAARARQVEEKQRRAKLRIEQNRKMLEEAEEKKAQEIEMKERQAEERARRLEELREEENERKQFELQLMEEKRLRAFAEAKREEELRAQELLARQDHVEEALQTIQENKERNLAIQKEQKRLRIEAKLRNAERMKRKKEYERMKLMNKLEDDSSRIDNMLEKKRLITQKRKEATIKAKIKRDMISTAMEQIRLFKKWDQADKLLEKIQDESVTSVKKTGKRNRKHNKRSSSARHTQSAADLLTPYEQQKASEAIAIRTAKKIEKYNMDNASKMGRQYISPYEAQTEQNRLEKERAAKAAKRTTVVPAFASLKTDDGSIVF